ncbi:MAG: 2Fe-2S iron-sulfur cluster binding domain-containing protein [Vitreoscilla sp.]|nr:2Fe-2S iron-sulfur cluster binding domain-containing protein [Burkholderiales bacterium]MBP6337259.1 2Fe-2S iron-sulfur cluster binding domain-containing protein [Vitreoscilla sp.]MBP6676307.1 2Fe-2S iron-sulfur cluster binding domain-containing protein [Vitreoscilla sp.]
MSLIRLHSSGRTVECASGDTVLEALEKAGYALPNNCRAGACGECKIKVLAGHFDQGFVLDMALSQDERKQGFGLMCMAKPLSDELVIEWGSDDAKPKLFPPREHLPYVVTDRITRTPRIVELRLRPLGNPMRYWPGQYVQLGDASAGVPLRSYSLASAPREDGELVLQIAHQKDGFTSRWAHERLQTGDLVQLSGPYGTFIGDPSVDTPVLCLAAGSGLAPILALSEAALKRGYKQAVTLMFSGREKADLYDAGLMAWWQAKHRSFKYLPTLTQAAGPDWTGLRGRIPALLPTVSKDLSGHSVFVAGSPSFVDDCVAAAKALGAKPELIHTEGYFAQSVAQR